MSPAGPTFAVVAVTLLIAHSVADHWVQTGTQARDKSLTGWPGRWACLAHVLTYTLTTATAVGAVWWLFALPVTWWGVTTGQVVSAVTHYWADRRFTLEWLCDRVGKGEFYRLGRPRRVMSIRMTRSDGFEMVRPYRDHGDRQPPGLEVGWDNLTLGTGAYALDQSWHLGWLGVAAVVTVVL